MIEPRRLLDLDPDSELTRALREARRDLGEPARMSALQMRIAAQLAAAPALLASPSAAATAFGATKIGLAVVIALAGAGAAYHWFSSERAPASAPAPRASVRERTATPSAPPSAAPAAEATALAPHADPTPVPQPRTPAVASGAPRARQARATLKPSARAATTVADADGEVALIWDAQQALDRDPARTLTVVQEHEQRFARGVLAEEREVLRIDALISLGRNTDALRSARAFVTRFEASPQRRRMQTWLEAHETP